MKPTVSDRSQPLRPLGRPERPHGRVERGEQQVLGEHVGQRQPVEQGRLAGVGVADQGHDRPARAPALGAVQVARALHLLQLALDLDDAVADQAAVDLELGFAGAAEEAEAAALPLQMGPGPHQPAALVAERGQLDLQLALARAGARAEDLQDQPGPVDDLELHSFSRLRCCTGRQGGQSTIDKADLLGLDQVAKALDRAGSRAASPGRTAGRARSRHGPRRDRSHAARPTASSSCSSGARSPPGRCFRAGCRTRSTNRGRGAAVCGGAGAVHRLTPSRVPWRLEELNRPGGHHRGDRVLVDELRMRVAPQQHGEIVEPRDDALQFDAVHQEDGDRGLVLSDVV